MNSSADYSEYPLATPLPGQQYNFVNPENRNVEVLVGMCVFLGVASITMLIRVYSRLALRQQWAWEDLAVFIGFAAIAAHDAVTFTIAGSGSGEIIGTHIWNVKLKYITKELNQRILATVNLYAVAAVFVKLALFSLYLRLFKPNRITRILVYLGIATCAVFYTVSLLVSVITCVPDPRGPNDTATWLVKEAECHDTSSNMAFAQGIFGTLSDIYLLIIPVQMVWRLHLPTKRKLGVSGVFLTGLIAIACSICSLVFRARSTTDYDYTWSNATIYIFSNAEVCAGIVCVNVPLLPALCSQQVKRPVWLRLPENIDYYLPSIWSRKTGNSSKPLMESERSITLQQQFSVHHGSQGSVETDDNEMTKIPPSSHIKGKTFYHYDIHGGDHV